MSEEAGPTLDAARIMEVLDGVEVLVCVKDLEGRVLYLNRACAESLGHPRETLLGRLPPANVEDDAVRAWHAQDRAVLEHGGPLDFEETVEGHTYLTHKVPLFDPDGRGVAVIGMSTEITQRKLAEEQLRNSAAQLHEAQQLAGLGSWHWDLEKQELTWSPELQRILGIEPGTEPIGTGPEALAFVHPDDRALVREAGRAALSGEGLELDLRIVREDGTQRIVHCRGELTRDADGTARHLDGTCVDVTDARRAHARLADAQRLAQIGFWDLALDTLEVTWSPEMYGIYGVDPEHFIPTVESVRELIVPEDRDRLEAEVTAGSSTDEPFEIFVHLRRPDGDLRELRVRAAVSSTPGDGRHLHGISQDVTDIRQNEQALAEAVELFRSSFDRAPVGMALVGLDGSFELVNQALCEFYGRTEAEVCELSVTEITHPEDRVETAQAFRGMLAGDRLEYMERKRYVRPDGEVRWGAVRALLIRDTAGRPLHFLVTTLDITERRAGESRRAAKHEVATAMARGGSLQEALPQMVEGIGYAMGWTRGSAWLVDPIDQRKRLEASWRGSRIDESSEQWPGEQLLESALETGAAVAEKGEGLAFPLLSDREVLGAMTFHGPQADRLDDELIVLLEALGRQVGEFVVRKRGEERLFHQALHDPLTGLPNRILFFDRLDQAIRRMRRGPAPLAVLFLDFDGFKTVNDRFGHEGGDEVLRRAAARVSSAMRAEDTVGRFGGDELVILTEHVSCPDAARRMSERILGKLSPPLMLEGKEILLSASIGVCIASDPEQTREELLRAADAAMYNAKSRGGGGFVVAA